MNNHHTETELTYAQMVELVISSLQDVLDMGNGNSTLPETIGADTRLIGREAVLDSMGLVNLIVEIEQRLEDDLGMAVVLADDRAMSQQKSPFRSVGSLADYLSQLVGEAG